MRTTNFDAVAASSPLDKTASVVRDGSGYLWDAKVDPWHPYWDAPPECKPLPEGLDDLTGFVSGRLRVVSYFGSKKGALWLVRCSCGTYETRRTRVLLHYQGQDEECCAKCSHLHHIRVVERLVRQGKYPKRGLNINGGQHLLKGDAA